MDKSRLKHWRSVIATGISIPSLLVFNNSEVTDRHIGLANKAVLKKLLTR
jgi:hypothetical protein